MMNAVLLSGHGGPEKLVYSKVAKPVPKDEEVLIRVKAASVNNTDLNSRTGWYSAQSNFSQLLNDVSPNIGGGSGGVLWGQTEPDAESHSQLKFPLIQGVDICGIVESVGPGADPSLMGKRVICDIWVRDVSGDYKCIGTELNGGFAEFAVMPQSSVYPIENTAMSNEELAAIPCAYGTAENMLYKTRIGSDDEILILGASGGVGSALIQLAKIRGTRSIIAIVGNEEKAKKAVEIGATKAYLRSDPELEFKLSRDHRITGCMDPVCGDFFGMALRVLTIGGRYVSCGAISNPLVSCDARNLIYKDLELHGATRFPKEVFVNLVKYIEQGLIRPQISKLFPLEQIHEAQKYFQEKSYFGKVVLIP